LSLSPSFKNEDKNVGYMAKMYIHSLSPSYLKISQYCLTHLKRMEDRSKLIPRKNVCMSIESVQKLRFATFLMTLARIFF
uniref:hypothetical protein n=1 Tax=Candidatus Cardinium sp. cBcalN2 TaxID=2699436 RepID=UPI001FB3218E